MKKKSFLASAFGMMLVALVSMSCQESFVPKSAPLTNGLSMYITKGFTGDTLYGVRKTSGEDVIAPKPAVLFAVDKEYQSILIEIDQSTKFRRYYTLEGKALAEYPLTGLKTISGVLDPYSELAYLGKAVDGKYYGCFISTGELFSCDNYVVGSRTSYIGLLSGDEFVVHKLDGSADWKVEHSPIYYVSQPYPHDIVVVVPGKKSATVYKPDGEELGTLSLAKWQKTIKGVKTETVGTVTVLELKEKLDV